MAVPADACPASIHRKLARLSPAGWVGSGLSEAAPRELRRILDAGAHVVVDVEFRGWTPAGELRHPVFKGWHEG